MSSARGQTQRAFRPPPTYPPPPNFQCHRCRQRGHWPQACPLLIKTKANVGAGGGPGSAQPALYQGLKFAHGIPFNMLEPVDDPNTPGAVITSRGIIAVPKVDRAAYARGKIEKEHFSEAENPAYDPSASPAQQADLSEMPEEYLCELCGEPMRDAVIVPCCGQSYCDTCIRPLLLAQLVERADRGDPSPAGECPKCHNDVFPDKLIPNTQFRRSIKKYLAEQSQRRAAVGPAGAAFLRGKPATPDATPSPTASPYAGSPREDFQSPSKSKPTSASQLSPNHQLTAQYGSSSLPKYGVGRSNANAPFVSALSAPEPDTGHSLSPAQPTFEQQQQQQQQQQQHPVAVSLSANLTAQPPPGVMARHINVSNMPISQLAIVSSNQLTFTALPPPTIARTVLVPMAQVPTPNLMPVSVPVSASMPVVALPQQPVAVAIQNTPNTLQPPPTLVVARVGVAPTPQIDVQQPPPTVQVAVPVQVPVPVPMLAISTAHPPPNLFTSPPKMQPGPVPLHVIAGTSVPPPNATSATTPKIQTELPPPTMTAHPPPTVVLSAVPNAGRSPLIAGVSSAPDTSLPPPMPPAKEQPKPASTSTSTEKPSNSSSPAGGATLSSEGQSSSSAGGSTSGAQAKGGGEKQSASSTNNTSGSEQSRKKLAPAAGSPSKGMVLSQEQFYKLKALALEKELRQHRNQLHAGSSSSFPASAASAPITNARIRLPQVPASKPIPTPPSITALPAPVQPAPPVAVVATTAPIPTITHDAVVSVSSSKGATATWTSGSGSGSGSGSAIPVVISSSKSSAPSAPAPKVRRRSHTKRASSRSRSPVRPVQSRHSRSRSKQRAVRSRSRSRSKSQSPSRSKPKQRSRSRSKSHTHSHSSRTSRDRRRRRRRDKSSSRSASGTGSVERSPTESVTAASAVASSHRLASKIIIRKRHANNKSLDEQPLQKNSSVVPVPDGEEAELKSPDKSASTPDGEDPQVKSPDKSDSTQSLDSEEREDKSKSASISDGEEAEAEGKSSASPAGEEAEAEVKSAEATPVKSSAEAISANNDSKGSLVSPSPPPKKHHTHKKHGKKLRHGKKAKAHHKKEHKEGKEGKEHKKGHHKKDRLHKHSSEKRHKRKKSSDS